ncbi:MAG: multicopper oxidase domain-containing protein [Pseudonocardiaceae bacterium]
MVLRSFAPGQGGGFPQDRLAGADDEFDLAGAREIWEVTNPGSPHSFHIHEVSFRILDIDGEPPPPTRGVARCPGTFPVPVPTSTEPTGIRHEQVQDRGSVCSSPSRSDTANTLRHTGRPGLTSGSSTVTAQPDSNAKRI